MFNKKEEQLYGIIGLGRFGSALAKTLADKGAEVLVMDCVEAKVKGALAYTDNAFVVENLSKEILQGVGLRNCDTVVVCIGGKIDVSILTTLTVINLGVKRVIAKATSYEQGCVLAKLGAEVVYPEKDMAIRLANNLLSSKILEYISLSDDIDISELKLTSKIEGMSLKSLNLREKFGLNVIAIRHNDKTIIELDPAQILSENDIIVVLGQCSNIMRFEKFLG